MNIVYDYLDYREFLKERIEHLKESNPNFSYRYFNKKAGLKSPSHMKRVIDGSLNLGQKGIYRISVGLGFSEKEARFFESLVNFNQADSFDQKERHYNDMVQSYPSKHPRELESKYYKIFSYWYYVAILELVRLDSFKNNPRWISKHLKPNVPVVQVKHALSDLIELELLKYNEDGRLIRTDKMITTPYEVKSIAVVKFQQQLTKLAHRAIESDEVKDKENLTITMALSKEAFAKIKDKMIEYRDEIRAIAEEQDVGSKEDVAHVNIQLFKLTNGGI